MNPAGNRIDSILTHIHSTSIRLHHHHSQNRHMHEWDILGHYNHNQYNQHLKSLLGNVKYIIHFDTLVVTFSDQAVMDGKARSLYLWRRVYGESMSPSEGFDIETPGTHPERYAGLLRDLKLPEQQLFWEAIWDLSNNPEALREHGIKAVYGNAVYKRLKPGLIYVFKIGADGQVYPETVLDM